MILSSFRSDICLNFLFSIDSVFETVILRSLFYCLIKVAFPLLRARLNSKSCPTHEVVQRENSRFKILLVSLPLHGGSSPLLMKLSFQTNYSVIPVSSSKSFAERFQIFLIKLAMLYIRQRRCRDK